MAIQQNFVSGALLRRISRVLPALLCLLALSVSAQAQVPEGLRGTLIVLNKRGHDASFIDLESGEVIATLPTGRGPHELIVTDDGRWAIGTDYSGGNSLTVFDVANLRVERTIDLSEYPRPHGILFLPGQEEVIVTSEASRPWSSLTSTRGRSCAASIPTTEDRTW